MALVKENQVGVLTVSVMEGRDLHPCDKSGLSDPFVVVTFGAGKFKTKHLQQTLEPIWTAQDKRDTEFKVLPTTPSVIQFEVFDWNRFARPKRMGYAELNIAKDLDNNKYSGWVPLQARKAGDKVRGDLKVKIEFKLDTSGGGGAAVAASAAPAKVGRTTSPSIHHDDPEDTALMAAIKKCDLESVKELLEQPDLEVNARGEYGYTALHQAATIFADNDADILCAVLKHPKVDVNAQNDDGSTPLHYFCAKYRSPNCGDAFDLFVKKGADMNKKSRTGETPLHKAMMNNSLRVILVNLLLDQNVDVNATNESGETALHYAVRMGREDLVKALLKAGPDLTIKGDRDKKTALQLAEQANQSNMAARLKNAQDVFDWLQPLGLSQYAKIFIREEIYMDLITEDLDEAMLTDIGITTGGHRVKLLNAAKQLRKEAGKTDEPKKSITKRPGAESAANRVQDEVEDENVRNISIQKELEKMKYLKKTDWVLHNSELEFTNQIGTGAAGIVYRGLYKDQDVAIKVLKTDQTTKELDEFKKEFQIMSSIEHPNLVFFFGAVLEPRLCMVLEMCVKGALFDVLKEPANHITWDRVFSYSKDMTRGLMALHTWTPQIVHRDFKSLNLLVNKKDVVKVADFGLSRFNTDTQKETLAKMRGTFAYVAPEVYFGKPFSTKSDVFSLSLVLWELARRCIDCDYMRPYQEYKHLNFDFQIIIQTAKKGLRPTIPETCPAAFKDLILRCWSENMDDRPECEGILKELDVMVDDYKANSEPWQAAITGRQREKGEA